MARSPCESSYTFSELLRTLPSLRGQGWGWLVRVLCQTRVFQEARNTFFRTSITRPHEKVTMNDSSGQSGFTWLIPHAVSRVSGTAYPSRQRTPPSRSLAARGERNWEGLDLDGVSVSPVLGLAGGHSQAH